MGIIRDQFVFFSSFHEATKGLPAELYKEVLTALCEYALTGIEPQVSAVCKGFLALAKPNIDNAQKRYDSCIENGKKGGNPNFKKGKKNPYYVKKDNPTDNPTDNQQNNPDITPVLPPDNLNKDKDIDIDILTSVSNNAHARTHEGEYFFAVKELCLKHLPVIYERHLKKPTGDYHLGIILNEVEPKYGLEELESIFKHAAKTYIVKPKMQNLDLLWLLNNLEKVRDTPEEDFSAGCVSQASTPQPTTKSAEELLRGLPTLDGGRI